MNIIVSGWPGAGTTSISLMVANLLGYKYLYAGGVMKFLAERAIGAVSGPKYIEFERDFGPKWDKIWEAYAVWKLANTDKLLLEGKTTGFLSKETDIYKVMVIANVEARIARATGDKREDPAATIRARDFEVRQRWFSEFNIDIYNIQQINQHYNLVMDNSHMTIAQELEFVLSNILKQPGVTVATIEQLRSYFTEFEALFKQYGKVYFYDMLVKKGMLITPQDVLKEWLQHFNALASKLGVDLAGMLGSTYL